tara:strand:+ start:378 stop:602 length:225 start_codon:yes stop_codon:yes gene_type:complete
MMSSDSKDLSFEEAIQKLEAILKKLESEETPLDQMIDLYEKANTLTNICKKKLEAADKKMTQLVKDQNNNLSEE